MEYIEIKCSENNDFFGSRDVISSCGHDLTLEENKIYYYRTNMYDFIIEQYYTICPNCGYFILLDEYKLSEEVKENAKERYNNEKFLYQKNSLKSQYINLCYKEEKYYKRVRER